MDSSIGFQIGLIFSIFFTNLLFLFIYIRRKAKTIFQKVVEDLITVFTVNWLSISFILISSFILTVWIEGNYTSYRNIWLYWIIVSVTVILCIVIAVVVTSYDRILKEHNEQLNLSLKEFNRKYTKLSSEVKMKQRVIKTCDSRIKELTQEVLSKEEEMMHLKLFLQQYESGLLEIKNDVFDCFIEKNDLKSLYSKLEKATVEIQEEAEKLKLRQSYKAIDESEIVKILKNEFPFLNDKEYRILCCYYHKMEVNEICELLNMPPGTFRPYRIKLRNKLGLCSSTDLSVFVHSVYNNAVVSL